MSATTYTTTHYCSLSLSAPNKPSTTTTDLWLTKMKDRTIRNRTTYNNHRVLPKRGNSWEDEGQLYVAYRSINKVEATYRTWFIIQDNYVNNPRVHMVLYNKIWSILLPYIYNQHGCEARPH